MIGRALATIFATVLVGAIWAIRPQTIPLVSSAWAQRVSNSPAASPITELRSIERLKLRHTVYVAAYSTIKVASGKGKVNLATTLTIHNTSRKVQTNILRIDYFDTAGNVIQNYLTKPVAIRPLGSAETFVRFEDTREEPGQTSSSSGGLMGTITEPLIEAVMVGTMGAQGFSFTSRGKAMAFATP